MDISASCTHRHDHPYRFWQLDHLWFMATTVMRVDAQQLVPFGDVRRPRIFLRRRSLLGETARSPSNVHRGARCVSRPPERPVENGLSHDHQR